MSKYVYEQFVTSDQREKMTNDASGVRKTYFAAGKLDPLTPEKRLNTLYSAIRDVEGDETHPIVKALKNTSDNYLYTEHSTNRMQHRTANVFAKTQSPSTIRHRGKTGCITWLLYNAALATSSNMMQNDTRKKKHRQ